METPVALLKIAVNFQMYETDVVQRTNRAIKASRIITDIIPFDKRNQALLEEPDIMKYMMLCWPLNPGSMVIIINTMIDKFKKLPHFIKYMWSGFEFIAQIEERQEKLAKAKGAAIKLLQLGVQRMFKVKNKDDTGISKDGIRMDYCEEITNNREQIKLRSLEYLEKILRIYFKEKHPDYPFTPDIQSLLKKYISCTTSVNIIEKARSIVDVVKELDYDKDYDLKIDEFANKRLSYIENPTATPRGEGGASLLRSFSSVKDALMKGLKSPSNAGETPTSNTNAGDKRDDKGPSEFARRSRNAKAKTEINLNKKSSAIMEESESASGTDASLSQEKAVLESLKDEKINNLEDWLSDCQPNEIPSLAKSDAAFNLLKENDNFESLITFILDPMMYSVAAGWSIRHNFLEEASLLEEHQLTETKKSIQMKILSEEPRYQTYMYRSYKAMQALCDLKNFRSMLGANHHIIENFFSMIYVCLNRNDAICNYNHLSKVAEFYLKREPIISITFIYHYNLIFKWLQGVEYEYVQKLIISLFNCNDEFLPFGPFEYEKFMKYIGASGFFHEVTNAILFGEKGLDAKKFDSGYKPPGSENLWNIEDEYEVSEIKEDISSFRTLQERSSRRMSSLNIEENDIDLIQDFMKKNTKPNFELINKRRQESKNPPERSPHRKAIEMRYHSVIQKILAEEEKSDKASSIQYLSVNDKSMQEADMKKASKLLQTGLSPLTMLSPANISHTDLNSSKNQVSGKKLLPISPTASQAQLKLPGNSKSNVDETQDSKRDRNNSKEGSRNGSFNEVNKSKRRDSEKINILNEPSQFKPKSDMNYSSKNRSIDPNMPKPRTILNELDKDVMGKQEMKMINSLYPYSTRNTIETDMDKDSKKPEYSVNTIRSSDGFSIALCEMLDFMVTKTLGNESKIREKIGLKTKVNHDLFWDSFFYEGKGWAFDRLLKNYLLKIKVHHLEHINSGFLSGKIVNIILHHSSQGHPFFIKHRRSITDVSRSYFNFLCKAIIHSHAWIQRADPNVFLQTYKVKDPLGTARIMLAETLCNMILNDSINSYGLLHEVNDTTWHTLIVWFFEKKTNEAYQRIFYRLMEAALKHSNEKLVLTILMKLNLSSSLYKTWYEICQNNVFLKDQQIDSILYQVKKFVFLINEILETKDYPKLKEQFNASHSWQDLKKRFIQIKEKKPTKKLVIDARDTRTSNFLSPLTPVTEEGKSEGKSKRSVNKAVNSLDKSPSFYKKQQESSTENKSPIKL